MSPAAGARNFASPLEARCGAPGVWPAPSRGAQPSRLLAQGWWLQPTLSRSNLSRPREPGEREHSSSHPPFSKASGSLEPGGEQHQLHPDGIGRGFLKGGELCCTCRPGSLAVSAKVLLPDPNDPQEPEPLVRSVATGSPPVSPSLPTEAKADPWDKGCLSSPHSAPHTGAAMVPSQPLERVPVLLAPTEWGQPAWPPQG